MLVYFIGGDLLGFRKTNSGSGDVWNLHLIIMMIIYLLLMEYYVNSLKFDVIELV